MRNKSTLKDYYSAWQGSGILVKTIQLFKLEVMRNFVIRVVYEIYINEICRFVEIY